VLSYIPGSTVKVEQLIGEEDKERHRPTLSRTFTRFDVLGTDLGYSFEHDGHCFFLFGDTVGHVSWAEDTIAMTDARDPEKGVRLDFLMDGKGKYLVIAPPGISMGPFETPVGGISIGGQMYVVVRTTHSKDWTKDRAVLTKFIPPGKFHPLRTMSTPPTARFITQSLHLQPGPMPRLPAGGPYVIIWGTGKYRKSDAYLSIVPAAHFESGQGTLYFTGVDAVGRRQDDNERAVGFSGADLLRQGLDNLRRIQKSMEVGQHEDRRAVLRSQGVDRPDFGQRIATGIRRCVLPWNLQARGDIPDGKPPVLVAA